MVQICLAISKIYTNIVIARWTLVYPEKADTTLLMALDDGWLETCVEIGLTEELIWKASVTPAYGTLMVSIVVSGNDIAFGPNPDSSKCAMATSLLMTQGSRYVDEDKETCNPFCDVPTTCLIQGKESIDTMNRWSFICACPGDLCNDLFLVLRSGSVLGRSYVCEISLEGSYVFLWPVRSEAA